ncbi:Gfo/Idh/MocA family protein [Aerosakkonemataceae cyanobacterium BLCC-F154]|uniref:Gfo/Idh/MocA family protein n=1 Tax=Floridaenema fluviatile BLCC-F154 TaxID=3153640 RepID=A0ABV4YDD7_9CYAN
MSASAHFSVTVPLKVGLVGTGYAAKLRAETLQSDSRVQLVAVAGNTPERTESFAQTYQAAAVLGWQQLVQRPDLDLVIIGTINSEHGAIAHAALNAGKHVVVEYPLALNPWQGEELISLAANVNKLLHVEHIELLGGLHQALKQNLGKIGTPFYARYSTINPQKPAPRKWTYHPNQFGFPFVGALSRLHRLIDLFGKVASVSCESRFWSSESEYYTACLCTAKLRFTDGLIAELTYGKGEVFHQATRPFEVYGDNGCLMFNGDEGYLIQGEEKIAIDVGSRRGLFAKETKMVLDRLIEGTPLYVTPDVSLYTLKIADAVRRASETGKIIEIL